MPISTSLYDTLKAWYKDATGPSPSGNVRTNGLCDYASHSIHCNDDAYVELMQLFYETGDINFPFGGESEYARRVKNRNQHANMQRLDWVSSFISEYEQHHSQP